MHSHTESAEVAAAAPEIWLQTGNSAVHAHCILFLCILFLCIMFSCILFLCNFFLCILYAFTLYGEQPTLHNLCLYSVHCCLDLNKSIDLQQRLFLILLHHDRNTPKLSYFNSLYCNYYVALLFGAVSKCLELGLCTALH